MKYSNVYYQEYLVAIGGVETFMYELARKYCDRDLTIIYSGGDPEQIKRLKKYVRCIKYNGEIIECDKAFFNYSVKIIDNIKAKEYIQIVHADFLDKSLYPKYKPMLSDKVQTYYGVSKNNAKSFEKLTGRKIGVAYNPITIDPQPRLLRLIAPQRLTSEKGGNRLEYLVKELDKSGLFYQLEIFSNDKLTINSPNVIYREPTLDIRRHIANSDYLVLLSDTEGFCYGLYEALNMGVPVICTNLPILNEMGVTKDNGIVVEFDMSNLDVNEIYDKAGKFKFEYEPKKDIWGELLTKEKSTYKEELNMKYKVEALKAYEEFNITDNELGYVPKEGETFTVTKQRLDVLLGENKDHRVYVKVLEEIKPKETKKKTTTKKKGGK
ncbi:MAG: glycosyltransferase [Bacilli bacterium]|nr:glycosyltransferase [Bacilli bacterium]